MTEYYRELIMYIGLSIRLLSIMKVVMVEPTEGYIQPGKSIACKLVFCSNSPSSNYNFDQICKVT